MDSASRLRKVPGAIRRALHLLAKPVRIDQGNGGIVIYPYRGYGSQEEIFLMGRIFKQQRDGSKAPEGTVRRDIIDLIRRILRRGLPGAVVSARFCETQQRVRTDPDGYFKIHLHGVQLPPSERLWHQIILEVVSPSGSGARATGDLFVPPKSIRYAVISDIDDTVMYTGVANKAMMLYRMFIQGAQSRMAFPGVAAFYKSLHYGISGADLNPMLYVSRGPWSLYEVIEEFFHLHDIPVGPILFLREWGISLRRPFPRHARGHKLDLIRKMLSIYRDVPFVLIGDSGQRDPEIYARVVRENPGRILAIYIRNIGSDTDRSRAIEILAREVIGAGSTLLLASDSFSMAEHAAGKGLISPEAMYDVLRERAEQQVMR